MLSEELVVAFLIGFALGVSIRNEQLKRATEQRDRAENMLRNVSKEYAEMAMDCVHAMDRADKCQKSWKKSGRSAMSRGYIKVSVGPGLNLRPSISFVDRTRIEADGQQLTKDAEQKFTMILSKKVFAPKKEYIEWAMNKLPEMPYDSGTFYEVERFFSGIIADYDLCHSQTVEMELETLIRKEKRRFPEMQDSGSAKIIPVEVKFRETRSRIGIFEYLKEAIKNGRSKID